MNETPEQYRESMAVFAALAEAQAGWEAEAEAMPAPSRQDDRLPRP